MNVREVLAEAALRWPERPAIVDRHGTMSFRQLQAEVCALEAHLQAHDVRPRQGLAVIARNGRGFIAAVFAGLGVGATVMPISPQLTDHELGRMCTRAQIAAFLDDGTGPTPVGTKGTEYASGAVRFRTTTTEHEAPLVPHVPDAAFVRFTSGTTGTSKGVAISHGSVLARTSAARKALSITEHDTIAWVLPMAYHFIVTIVMYVRYGACIAVADELTATAIFDTIEASGATVLYAAPTQYRVLGGAPGERRPESLRMAISTASAIPASVAHTFHERCGLPISQIYGIIEIGLPAGNLGASASHPDTIGHPLPEHDVGILDAQGHPVPDGELGRLAMRGPGMFDAYMDPPRMREDVLENGWFMTGDLAKRLPSGVIQVAGREKSMINTAGLKVFPEEVEGILTEHPDVGACRVYGVPHPVLGEVVQADVVLVADALEDVRALRRHCRARLSSFKIPQRILFVEVLERTGSGKIVRHSPDIVDGDPSS